MLRSVRPNFLLFFLLFDKERLAVFFEAAVSVVDTLLDVLGVVFLQEQE